MWVLGFNLTIPITSAKNIENHQIAIIEKETLKIYKIENQIKLIKTIPLKGKSFHPSLCNENVVYHSYIRGETSEVFLNNKQITRNDIDVYESYPVCITSNDTIIIIIKADRGIVEYLVKDNKILNELIIERSKKAWENTLPSLAKSKNYYHLSWSFLIDSLHEIVYAKSSDLSNWQKEIVDIGEISNIIAKDNFVFLVYYQTLLRSKIILLYSDNEFKNYKKVIIDENEKVLRNPSVGFDGKKLTICYISNEMDFPVAKCKISLDFGKSWTIKKFGEYSNPVNYINLSDDGNYLITSHSNGEVRIYSLK
jgi:hypothetical protein